ncbi:MAG: chorismate-binding protein [Polyangiales bacterium]
MYVRRVELPEPVAIARALAGRAHLVWLDSNRSESRDGRFSYLAVDPVETVEARFGEDAIEKLSDTVERSHAVNSDCDSDYDSLPFNVADLPSWIGYLSYDAAFSASDLVAPRHERANVPIAFFARYDALIVVDHHKSNASYVVGDTEYAGEGLLAKIRKPLAYSAGFQVGELDVDDADAHRIAIEAALDAITAGEIYQVNLARRWCAPFVGDALLLWTKMRDASAVPLGAYIEAESETVLACTMERFLQWNRSSRRILTRPIKGTLKRNDAESSTNASTNPDDLLANPKERAEHVMIVDLMRNDLGRVATIGSVRVDEALVVEPFTGLYHLERARERNERATI